MARELTDHKVEGQAMEPLRVHVMDEPGEGGACHNYMVSWNGGSECCLINFQNGPIKERGVNGISHESLLAILIDRLNGFQGGEHACEENRIALGHMEKALYALKQRTAGRIGRGVEGTSEK